MMRGWQLGYPADLLVMSSLPYTRTWDRRIYFPAFCCRHHEIVAIAVAVVVYVCVFLNAMVVALFI